MTTGGQSLLMMALLSAPRAATASPPPDAAPVEGGTFRMGTPPSALPELKRRYGVSFRGVFEDETPDHEVTVAPLRIDRREVTNARFAAFVKSRPEWGRGRLAPAQHNGHYLEQWEGGRAPAGKADHPVVFVTWAAAQAFCLWAGGRLPTEAEWEYAARAGGDREFPWGEEMPTPARANYGASGLKDTRAVGSYPANPLGLHDLAGNVWEFTLDPWPSPYGAGAQNEPAPVASAAEALAVRGRRAIRGGSFGGGAVNLRTRWRDSHEVTNAVAFVGFRCAYPAEAARTPR